MAGVDHYFFIPCTLRCSTRNSITGLRTRGIIGFGNTWGNRPRTRVPFPAARSLLHKWLPALLHSLLVSHRGVSHFQRKQCHVISKLCRSHPLLHCRLQRLQQNVQGTLSVLIENLHQPLLAELFARKVGALQNSIRTKEQPVSLFYLVLQWVETGGREIC